MEGVRRIRKRDYRLGGCWLVIAKCQCPVPLYCISYPYPDSRCVVILVFLVPSSPSFHFRFSCPAPCFRRLLRPRPPPTSRFPRVFGVAECGVRFHLFFGADYIASLCVCLDCSKNHLRSARLFLDTRPKKEKVTENGKIRNLFGRGRVRSGLPHAIARSQYFYSILYSIFLLGPDIAFFFSYPLLPLPRVPVVYER